MQLSQMTWMEVEAYLQRSTGIIVPIGSTEQHGPNGLLGTDAMCPELIAQEAAREEDILVAPTFSVGMAQHHLGFPGTISLRPSTMIAALTDWVRSLERHGFTHLYFLNGHGGNAATIDAAFAELYAASSFADAPSRLALVRRNWWELSGIMAECRRLYPNGLGSHATPAEVAVTYHAYPEAARRIAEAGPPLSPRIAPMGPIRDAADYRTRFADGRIGSDPSGATARDGRQLVNLAARALIPEYRAFLES